MTNFINTNLGPEIFTNSSEGFALFPRMEARYTIVWDTTTKFGQNGRYSIGGYDTESQNVRSFKTLTELDTFIETEGITVLS